MHRGATDRTATTVRGYAWHVYPDPATPGVFERDNPFSLGDPHDPGLELLRTQGGSCVGKLRQRQQLEIQVIGGADHTFTARPVRERLIAVLAAGLDQVCRHD